MVTYNMGRGGSKNPALWARSLHSLEPDLFFMQESRDPTSFSTEALQGNRDTPQGSCLWTEIPGRRWGSGLWLNDGALTPLPVPEAYTGRVIAALVEGRQWPRASGVTQVVALSIHAPAPKGSTYIKEVGYILDFAKALAGRLPLILAGDFNVAVGLRRPEHSPTVTRGELGILRRLRDEFDLVPCWQTAHPGEPLARTLRWMRRNDSLPYHCDGIFVPAAWASALQACTVLEDADWCALSDHNPVVATLRTT
ncbi:MAG TPA: endonuclease/exonuclease/phosphatase family protein [Chloroflexia bacterium]|nr:endonuclease/exonuclease/phosphatase family protein [Chloroflexia bacterium]